MICKVRSLFCLLSRIVPKGNGGTQDTQGRSSDRRSLPVHVLPQRTNPKRACAATYAAGEAGADLLRVQHQHGVWLDCFPFISTVFTRAVEFLNSGSIYTPNARPFFFFGFVMISLDKYLCDIYTNIYIFMYIVLQRGGPNRNPNF